MNSSRRRFLQKTAMATAGISVSAHEAFAKSLITALFRSSLAQAAGVYSPRYYVNLQLYGAPSRYQFDHWLRTNSDDPAMQETLMTSTSFAYNGSRQVTGGEYKTVNYNGVLVPHIFSTLSPTDRSAFLDSFLVMRGYGSGVDGHDANAIAQMQPLSSAASISGLLADHSEKYFQAVQYPVRTKGSSFNSSKSIAINLLGAKPLDDLFKPIVTTSAARTLRLNNQNLFSNVRGFLNSIVDGGTAIDIAKGGLDNAYKILSSNLGDISSTWTSTVDGYKTAITDAVRLTNLPGIHLTQDGSQSLAAVSDAGGLFGVDRIGGKHTFANGKNMLTAANEAYIADKLAESLALAECCISNDLVSVIEGQAGDLFGVRLDPAVSGSTTNLFQFGADHHQTGGYPTVYLMTMYYRGLLAGLLLLRQRLIAAGKWNNTVVHIVSEFNRSVRATNFGSDHGFNQMISSAFSGVISGGPYVVGNIDVNPPSSNFIGSQGLAAPIAGYNQTGRPNVQMMTSTMSALLDVSDNPWRNFALPLVRLESGGTLSLPFGKGKLIA